MAATHEPHTRKIETGTRAGAGAKLLRRGSRLGKYRLDRRLGRGAFSEVWKARDTVQQRNVAAKIATADSVRTFGRYGVEHEAMVSSRLQHLVDHEILEKVEVGQHGSRFEYRLTEAGVALSGQVAGRIDAVRPVGDIIADTVREFAEAIEDLAKRYASA